VRRFLHFNSHFSRWTWVSQFY